MDFQDADIRNVLKVLAFKSGVNIVAAPDVTGVVNIELKDVPWQKALDVILSTYGYGFDRKGNIITVMTVENLKKYREDSLSSGKPGIVGFQNISSFFCQGRGCDEGH